MGIIVTMRLETCVHGGQWIRDHFYSFLQKLSESLGSKIFEHPFTQFTIYLWKMPHLKAGPLPLAIHHDVANLGAENRNIEHRENRRVFCKAKARLKPPRNRSLSLFVFKVLFHMCILTGYLLLIQHGSNSWSDIQIQTAVCSVHFPNSQGKSQLLPNIFSKFYFHGSSSLVISVISPILAGHSPSWWFP